MINSRITHSHSESGNTSTEDLVVINGLTASMDATEVARAIRIPRHRSFLDESSSEDLNERLHRTANYDIDAIDETFEFLLEKTFSEERDGSFLSMDASSQLWKITVNVSTIDDANNSSSVMHNFSFSESLNPRSPKFQFKTRPALQDDSLRSQVYFEQPFTLVTLGVDELYLHHMVLDQEDYIPFPAGDKLFSACVLPDGQIIATGGKECASTAYRYQTTTGWEVIGKLHNPRTQHATVFHKGTVYVIGGERNGALLGSVERVRNEAWEQVASLNNPRRACAAVSMNSRLYVTGGVRENAGIAGIEIMVQDMWIPQKVAIPDLLYDHACIFTPHHELVILGGNLGDLPSSTMAIITEQNGLVSEEFSECEDVFRLNSWSYMEDENEVLAWGHRALWIFDINERKARVHKFWRHRANLGNLDS